MEALDVDQMTDPLDHSCENQNQEEEDTSQRAYKRLVKFRVHIGKRGHDSVRK